MKKNEIAGIRIINNFWYHSCFFQELIMAVGAFGIDGRMFLDGEFIHYGKNCKLLKSVSPRKILEGTGLGLRHINLYDAETIAVQIDRGCPVFAGIDTFYYKERADHYVKVHEKHFILVFGYDFEKGTFHVIDHEFTNSYSFVVKDVPMQEIIEAERAFAAGICKQKYTSMVLYRKKENCFPNVIDIVRKERIAVDLENLNHTIDKVEEYVMQGGAALDKVSKKIADYFIEIYQRKQCLNFSIRLENNEKLHDLLKQTMQSVSYLRASFYRYCGWNDAGFYERSRDTVYKKAEEFRRLETEFLSEAMRCL